MSTRIYKSNANENYDTTKETSGYITKTQLKTIISIEKGTLRKLYLALVIRSNKYKKSDNTFEFSYNQINSVLGSNINRNILLQRVKELESLGLVKIIRRGHRESENLKYETNIYRIIESPEELNDKNCYVFDDITLITYEKIIKATEELLSRKQIRNLCKNKTILKKRLNVFKTNEEAELIVKSREIV